MASFSNKNPAKLTAKEFWSTIDDEVSARTLWRFLHVEKKLDEWLCPILAELHAQDGIDYRLGRLQDATAGDVSHETALRARMEIMLTPDLAKEIGILECTTRGRETRQYFIDSDKKFSKRMMDDKSQLN